MKKTCTILFFISIVCCSCNNDDETGTTPIDTNSEVTDLRDQYTVSTLTEHFEGSGGAAVGPDGFIYVADFGNQLNNADGRKVTRVDPTDGSLTTFATGLSGPSGNVFDGEGNLYQSNIRGNTVSKITPEGEVTTYADSDLRGPVGATIDASGNLYICNCSDNSITKVLPDGSTSIFVRSTLLSCPNGLTIDDSGNLYPVNFNNGKIFKVTPGGDISNFTTIPSGSCAHIIYRDNKFYVVGRQANQVFLLDMQGGVSLIAGSGTAGDQNGSGEVADFFVPNGIALSKDGSKIYVVDKPLREAGAQLNPVVVRVIEKK